MRVSFFRCAHLKKNPLPWPVPVPSVTTERLNILRPLIPQWIQWKFPSTAENKAQTEKHNINLRDSFQKQE